MKIQNSFLSFLIFGLWIISGPISSSIALGNHSNAGWRCSASTYGSDKHGQHFATGSSKSEAALNARSACDLFHFPGACSVNQCSGNTGDLPDSVDAPIDSETDDSNGHYLGCTVDDQQCGSRASRYGYPRYYAERWYGCANVAKFGCWGRP